MKNVRDILITLLASIVIFALLQITVGSFKVYGLCMLPNIQHGDYIMVDKISYRLQNPERGDVIVFHSPRNPNSDLIKRVIGLPGDTIEIKDSKVFINGTPIGEPYIKEPPKYEYPLQKIPEGQYFVLGDNRNNSADSHTGWLMPQDNIVGKAWFSYWPPPKWATVKHYGMNSNK